MQSIVSSNGFSRPATLVRLDDIASQVCYPIKKAVFTTAGRWSVGGTYGGPIHRPGEPIGISGTVTQAGQPTVMAPVLAGRRRFSHKEVGTCLARDCV
jgi:hypothetical protein